MNNIPENWKKYITSELFDFFSSLSASREELSNEGYCYLHYGDIHSKYSNTINVEECYDELPKLNIQLNTVSNKILLKHGDIVFLDASEDYEGVSRHVVIYNASDIPFLAGLHTVIARSKNNHIDLNYKKYCFCTADVNKQFKFYATGIKVYSLTKENFKKINILLPPLPEQQKIAEILTTWDTAISRVEKLLEIQKNKKKSLMQKLLTQKVRLKGFSGKWEEKKLGEVCEFCDGYSFSSKDFIKTAQNSVQVARITEINNFNMNSEKVYVKKDLINELELQKYIINIGDLLLSLTGASGFNFFIWDSQTALLNQRAIKINISKIHYSAMKKLLPFLLYNKINVLGTGQNNNLSKELLQSVIIPLPPLPEQEAIAEILSKADQLLSACETKLANLKTQKKALMQVLLTGKIRVQLN